MIESVVNFQMILLLYLQISSCAINLLVKGKKCLCLPFWFSRDFLECEFVRNE